MDQIFNGYCADLMPNGLFIKCSMGCSDTHQRTYQIKFGLKERKGKSEAQERYNKPKLKLKPKPKLTPSPLYSNLPLKICKGL